MNEGYFDKIDSWQKAYLLGFLLADGYNNEKRGVIQVIVSDKDVEVLEFFKKELECDKPIGRVVNKNVSASRIDFCSSIMSQSLKEKGCFQNKTFLLSFPKVKDKYLSDFVRGYFDGDGCFYHCIANRSKGGDVLIGEVSSINDDTKDNRFLETIPRFTSIEEDEPALFCLCNEYP